MIDAGEGCDDGANHGADVPGACRADCILPTCGDGTVDPGEECDEGEGNDDGSVDGCRTNCRWPYCGDGVLREGEACDDGANNDDRAPDACRTTCRSAFCGDGAVDTGESCDDGDRNSASVPDACRPGCVLPTCGDGVVDLGESCDDGVPFGDDGCDRLCRPAIPEICLTRWGNPGVPVLDLREVGIPDGTGFRVVSSIEESGSRTYQTGCGPLEGRIVVYAYPIPVVGDLVVELVSGGIQPGTLGIWRSCAGAPVDCVYGEGAARAVVPDVSPAQGAYFVQVHVSGSPAEYELRIDVRPPLGAGDACALDGHLGRCDAAGGTLACADPDADGVGTCVPVREGGSACDPEGRLDVCREPLACREGVCGLSCGDGVRQDWEDCDDGNQASGDNCSPTCIGRSLSCADPFDLNLAWDPVSRRALWEDDTSRSVNRFGTMCGAGPAPDGVASFVAPTAGRYHFRLEVEDPSQFGYPVLSVLDRCEWSATPLACGTDWPRSATLDLAAGQRVFAVVGSQRLPAGPTPDDPPTSPFTLSVIGEDCGDGLVQGSEECDDGNSLSGDRCLPDCSLPGEDCGEPYPLPAADATGTSSWQGRLDVFVHDDTPPCDPGSRAPDAVASFTAPVAGRYAFELEDASAYLTVRSGTCGGPEVGCLSTYDADPTLVVAELQAGETAWAFVDQYNSTSFTLTVRPLVCGDGRLVPPEECDDGNTLPGDSCDAGCRVAAVAEVEPNDVRAQALAVPIGAVVTGLLPPGDLDYVALELVAGTSYTFTPFLGFAGGCVPAETTKLWLYDAGGDLLFTQRSGSCRALEFVAATTGRHYLRVDASTQREVGPYFLALGAP